MEIQCLWLSQRGRHTTLFLDFIDVFTLLKEYLGDKLLDDLIQVVLDLREHAEDLEEDYYRDSCDNPGGHRVAIETQEGENSLRRGQ